MEGYCQGQRDHPDQPGTASLERQPSLAARLSLPKCMYLPSRPALKLMPLATVHSPSKVFTGLLDSLLGCTKRVVVGWGHARGEPVDDTGSDWHTNSTTRRTHSLY